MLREPRLTTHTLKVLDAIISAPEEPSGADLSRLTALPSGTLYPMLLRLEKAGWLESRWEEVEPRDAGRPRRRLYRATFLGTSRARQEAETMQAAVGRLLWGR